MGKTGELVFDVISGISAAPEFICACMSSQASGFGLGFGLLGWGWRFFEVYLGKMQRGGRNLQSSRGEEERKGKKKRGRRRLEIQILIINFLFWST